MDATALEEPRPRAAWGDGAGFKDGGEQTSRDTLQARLFHLIIAEQVSGEATSYPRASSWNITWDLSTRM